jgi:hypothetical protein
VKTSPRQIRETIAKLKEFGQTFGGLKVKDLINGRSPVSGFVIDASIALAWYFDDEATDATRAYVLEIGAPHLLLRRWQPINCHNRVIYPCGHRHPERVRDCHCRSWDA